MNSSVVIEAVREGAADLGFIETPTVPGDLGSCAVGQDSIEAVAAGTHPWARTGVVSAALLSRTPLVLREPGSGTRQAFEGALAAAGVPLAVEPAAVLSTTLGVRSAIMAGLAPGALSWLAIGDDVRAGRLVRIRIRNLRINRPLTAIWAGARPSSGARDFLDVVGSSTLPG